MRDVEVDVWPGGPKEMFLRIVPNRITGPLGPHRQRLIGVRPSCSPGFGYLRLNGFTGYTSADDFA